MSRSIVAFGSAKVALAGGAPTDATFAEPKATVDPQ